MGISADQTANRAPWWLRAMNGVGRYLPTPSLEPEQLLAKARKRNGLQEFIEDEDFRPGLDILCNSLQMDAQLSPVGRLMASEMLKRALDTRLLWAHHMHARGHGQGRTQAPVAKLNPPLIVLGLPRSGTTLLHRLLSLAPQARALQMWELQAPYPPAQGGDQRRAEVGKGIGLIRRAAPDLDHKHLTSGDSAEECTFMFDSSMVSMSFWIFAPVYRYLEWWLARDQHLAYQRYRDHLCFLQAATPQQRLTLKAPVHTGFLLPLIAAIPDAMIVQTWRDPGIVTPSLHSLLDTLHHVLSAAPNPTRMAKANLDLLLTVVERNVHARRQLPAGQVFDLRYETLLADPLAAVRNIHQHFGLAFSAEYEQLLRTTIAQDTHSTFTPHSYRAEDFGQDSEQIRARFAQLVDLQTGLEKKTK